MKTIIGIIMYVAISLPFISSIIGIKLYKRFKPDMKLFVWFLISLSVLQLSSLLLTVFDTPKTWLYHIYGIQLVAFVTSVYSYWSDLIKRQIKNIIIGYGIVWLTLHLLNQETFDSFNYVSMCASLFIIALLSVTVIITYKHIGLKRNKELVISSGILIYSIGVFFIYLSFAFISELTDLYLSFALLVIDLLIIFYQSTFIFVMRSIWLFKR